MLCFRCVEYLYKWPLFTFASVRWIPLTFFSALYFSAFFFYQPCVCLIFYKVWEAEDERVKSLTSDCSCCVRTGGIFPYHCLRLMFACCRGRESITIRAEFMTPWVYFCHISQSQVSGIHHKTVNAASARNTGMQNQTKKWNSGNKKGKQANKAINCKSRVRPDHWMMDAGCTVCVYWGIECCLWAGWDQRTGVTMGADGPSGGRVTEARGHSVITECSSLLWFPLLAPWCLPPCLRASCMCRSGSIHFTGACVLDD